MRLYEHEGKTLLKTAGLKVPTGMIANLGEDPELTQLQEKLTTVNPPFIVKAQLLSGFRAKHGAIKTCQTVNEVANTVKQLLGKTFNDELCETVLVEQYLTAKKELFVSLTYDLQTRSPCFFICEHGGSDVEEHFEKNPDKINKCQIDITNPFTEKEATQIAHAMKASSPKDFVPVLLSLYKCFVENDCRLIEINPLLITKEELFEEEWFVAADAKIILDEKAHFRHPKATYTHRGASAHATTHATTHAATYREQLARDIDKHDHRGTAGSTYYDLDGDIAILASGGGASLTCMDALLGYGGKPANYTEYSGNPPPEKVAKLTQITLSKPGLCGAWIIGGTANFTDVYETMRGFIQGVLALEKKQDYPIVIRRAGPRDKEAFEMLHKFATEHGLDIHCYGEETPITVSAKIMAELATNYKKRKEQRP